MNELSPPSFSASVQSGDSSLRIAFQCERCAFEGWLVWSEPLGPACHRISSGLETLSDGFYMRMGRAHRGDVEIICARCEMPQHEVMRRIRVQTTPPGPEATARAEAVSEKNASEV